MFQEIVTMDAQGVCELIEGFKCDVAFPTFDAADVGTMEIASGPEFLLRPSVFLAQALDRFRHNEVGILFSHP